MTTSLIVLVFLVSSVSSVTIPIPTPEQLAWQEGEIMALIHFNMASFLRDGDPGCGTDNWGQASNPATFAPTELDPLDWVPSMRALGIKEAVLTAKHGCGFATWQTNATLPDGSPYGYNIQTPALDVVSRFSETMQTAGIGHGFYYSLTNNYYLNVCGMKAGGCGALQPGQVNVTQAEFEEIALAQLTELWTHFGNLTEIWFDGGYSGGMQSRLLALLSEHQPRVVAFNGGGLGIPGAARWVGTEGDMGPSPAAGHYTDVWGSYCCNTSAAGSGPCVVAHTAACDVNAGPYGGAGCPGGEARGCDSYYPPGLDYTLQAGDHWFYQPGLPLRPLEELIAVYHNSVGRNTVMELDFAVDRTGRLHDAHKKLYKTFGNYIRECYASPAASASSSSGITGNLSLTIDVGARLVDRFVIQEQLTTGQRVLSYSIVDEKGIQLSAGKSIGNKRIDLLPGNATASGNLTLRVHSTVGGLAPAIKRFAAFEPCGATSGS